VADFSPNVRVVEPAESLDPLGAAVLQSFGRMYGRWLSWGVARTTILGVLTVGILPMLVLPWQLRRFTRVLGSELWHLAEWMRLASGEPRAGELRDAVPLVRWRPGFWVASLLVMLLFGAMAGRELSGGRGLRAVETWREYRVSRPAQARAAQARAAMLWTIGLTIAYGLHWAHVRSVAGDLREFAARFNDITRTSPLPPVEVDGVGTGLRPVSLAVGIVLCAVGAVWALPMLVAAALQRRLTSHVSDGMRRQFAQRVRTMLQWRRPALAVPTPASLRQSCRNRLCKLPLPPDARFCPRCGSAVAMTLDAVA
jgi:hypothetical protein